MPAPTPLSPKDRFFGKLQNRPQLLNKAAIMFGARGLGLAFAALGSVWAARCLGPRNFGISGMVQSLALFAGTFLAVIYPLVLVRDYKNAADDPSRNRLIRVTNSYRLAVALFFCLAAAAMMALGLEPPSFHFAGWFFLPILFLTALQPTWIFQAAEKQQFQSMLAVLQPALTALYYAAVIRKGMSAGWDLLGIALVTAVLTFIYWRAVFRLTPFQGRFFAWDGWREMGTLVIKSRWLFLFFLCTYVYNNLDQPLLGWLSSLEEQGKYRTAVRVTDAAQGFLTILPSIFFPRFIEWRKRGEEFFWRRQGRLLAWGSLAGAATAALGFLLIPPVYVPVFGSAYAQAARPCAILVSAKIMDCLGQVYSLGLMTDHAYDKKVLAAGLLTASVSLGSNLLFIPKFGMTTAACVNLLSETLMLAVCFGLSWQRIGQIQKGLKAVEGKPPPEKGRPKVKRKPFRPSARPFFSVVIPVYNKKDYLRRSVGSVLGQSFRDFELVVVDDGSKDGSPAAVQSHKDKRVRLIIRKNAGVSSARNRGVAAARGKYVTFLDADDDWDKGYLAALKGLIEEFPDAGLYGTNYWVDDGVVKYANPVNLPPGWRGRMRDYYDLSYRGRPPFCTNTVCLPARLAKSIPFPLGIKAGEDLLVWFKASLKHDTAYWNKPFSTYYVTAADNTHATYFGSSYHLDWLKVGEDIRREGLLTPGAQKYVVWATLVQVRKMIANGYRAQALAKWWGCPKAFFPLRQAALLVLTALPSGAPRKLREFFKRRKTGEV